MTHKPFSTLLLLAAALGVLARQCWAQESGFRGQGKETHRAPAPDSRPLSRVAPAAGQARPGAKPRARDLGIPFDGTPGPLDAITDVKGVEVGHTTLISGSGRLVVGSGPVRTGVTAILPRGKQSTDQVFAGWFSLNGNGEMTGTTWVEESGFLEGPVMITNTHSVGTVRDSVIAWRVEHGRPADSEYWWSLPVVAETYDGFLNDTNGFHVKKEHVFAALEGATAGPVPEGNVGGGTGMICYEFKGGIGTASRRLAQNDDGYTVGVLVQCNCGSRDELRISGVPVGREIPGARVWAEGGTAILRFAQDKFLAVAPHGRDPHRSGQAARATGSRDTGSIIIVVATDAPLLPHQLKRLARRASLGLARTGSYSGDGSGDIFIAFSTANPGAAKPTGIAKLEMFPNDRMDPIFQATVQATEEAVINALVAAETMTGIDNHTVEAIPHDKLIEVLKKYDPARASR
jgi:L-aminopeptidase/D-esterase-like protein